MRKAGPPEVSFRTRLSHAMLLSLGLLVVPACFADRLAELYRHLPLNQRQPAPDSYGRWRDTNTTDLYGITEIGIERSGCLGACPVYAATIQANGRFAYDGIVAVKRKGHHTGSVSVADLPRLAQLIQDMGFQTLPSNFSAPATDQPAVYTSIVVHGKRKIIYDYGNAGPSALWAVEQLIDKLLQGATWDDKKSISFP